ncbi:MAG: autotransporter domain-containing protein [Selenomonadaceae bacterium]|nr:autotransporter domain-containing protein [Selenomonadaceae bacterium]
MKGISKTKEKKLSRAIAAALLAGTCFSAAIPAYAAELPGFFDWRRVDTTDRNSTADSLSIVPSVRDQGHFGTCWSFGALASYESSWMSQLKKAREAGENVNVSMPDFAESYLAWMAYAKATNEEDTDAIPRFVGTFNPEEGVHPIYDLGGFLSTSVFTILNKGVVAEASAPYQRFLTDWANIQASTSDTTAWQAKWQALAGNKSYGAIADTITPLGSLHDTYVFPQVYYHVLTDDEISNIKNLIMENGIVGVSNDASIAAQRAIATNGGWYSTTPRANHAQSLVGWDDDYVFKVKAADGSTLKGAFIMRNSWGDEWGNQGYQYISYRDMSLSNFYFHNAELDPLRYTINANHAPATENTNGGARAASESIAASFAAGKNHFLKGVMFYASANNMKYAINVHTGSAPGAGTTLYTQSGTFGEDGLAKYAGFRTVDLDKYVLLPQGQEYVVEVTTTDTEGGSAQFAYQKTAYNYGGYGLTFAYNSTTGAWEHDNNALRVFLNARGKETNLANGGDFTVAYLDDTDSDHSSVINLGSSTELYGTDAAHPNRKTLSNMTVDLSADVANFYGGTITGEGAVVKTGAGSLILTGANTHMGLTTVNEGTLAINGSVAGDAATTGTGVLMGSGKIGGTLNNQNVVIAGYGGEGNLTVKNLNSEGGTLVTYVGDSGNTKFVVENTAKVDGAMVQAVNDNGYVALPGEYEIVNAGTLTGTVANDQNNPFAVSDLVEQYGEASGNILKVKAVTTDNLAGATAEERATLQAMGEMSKNLDVTRREEMRTLFSLDAASAKKALAEIGSADAPQIMTMAQQSVVSAEAISDRLTTAFSLAPVNMSVPSNNLSDSEAENAVTVPVDMPVATVSDGWVKFTKHWGDMKSGANYHGSAISGGYDRAVNPYWRVGTFISYNDMSYGAESAAGSVYDTRFGFYAGYHQNADDGYLFIDYGWQRNRLARSVMGMTASAAYNSHLIELGGEYKHDLHAADGKIWHVSPFVGGQISHLTQGSYGETGAGVFNQNVASQSNTYFALQTGLEFKRYVNKGSYGLRLGVKHAFSGADPSINFHYEGNPGSTYTLKGSQDKTHFVMSLTGDTEFKRGWILGGDLRFQKGGHDRDLAASMMIRRVW